MIGLAKSGKGDKINLTFPPPLRFNMADDAPTTLPSTAAEPSMEEILASIRKIIADDDTAKTDTAAPGEVLELTQMVQEDGSVVDLKAASAPAATPLVPTPPTPTPTPAPPEVPQHFTPPLRQNRHRPNRRRLKHWSRSPPHPPPPPPFLRWRTPWKSNVLPRRRR